MGDPGYGAGRRLVVPDPAGVTGFPGVPVARDDAPGLSGQRVPVPAGRYDWIHLVLDGAPPGWEDELWLDYGDAVDPEWVRTLPSAEPAGPGTALARAAVPRRDDLVGLRLPDRPGVRLLALTLAAAGGPSRPSGPESGGA